MISSYYFSFLKNKMKFMHVSKVYATYIYIFFFLIIKMRTHLMFMVIHQQSRTIEDVTEGTP